MDKHAVVVVGASAGGIQALHVLLSGLPTDLAASVLVVLHIPTHSPSHLHEILARTSALPVTAAIDGELMEAGRVYVAPTDRHLLVQIDGRLRLTRGPKENRVRPAVDALFRSAASSCGSRVIGIVLTGNLDDGTAGLWAIKDRGGKALVQAPADAEFPSMPESALRHVRIDHTLTVADMPALLRRLIVDGSRADTPGPPSPAMKVEVDIALEGNAFQDGVMKLGPVSANTCPECHGVLVKIREGSVIRYRCHTGHAYSLETLLADVNAAIDTTLWASLRAMEERVLLLSQLKQDAHALEDVQSESLLSRQVQVTNERARRIRELVLDHESADRA
jgi:two-component system chemotaxis response regulator CheB